MSITAQATTTALWKMKVAGHLSTGFFTRLQIGEFHGLHTVVGVYRSGLTTSPFGKYGDPRKASNCVKEILLLVTGKSEGYDG